MADHASSDADLTRLFAPRSAALVGATDHPTSFGGRVFQQMKGFGYAGKIYPVNPRLKEIHGLACYPGLRELPEAPDHVGIIVSVQRVFEVLADCAAIGVPFATVYTAGFSESGTPEGRERQARLAAFAKSSGMRIMGPNCNGVVNFVDGFAMASTAAIKGPRAPAGNIGVVSQSGGLGQINIMWRAQEIGLGISYEASCGNEADLDALDFVRFMLRSRATDVVLLAVEAIKDGAKFKEVAHEAAEREKPIVVLKFGRTEAGGRAAASHTGAVAGDDAIADAVFRQYGLIRVDECDQLYETAVLLRRRRWPGGRGAAAVSPTGGNIVQLADVGARFGLEWPPYSEATQAALAPLLPGYGKVGNPTDMTSIATGEQGLYRQALNAIAADDNVQIVVPIYASISRSDLQRGADFVSGCEKPAAMLWVGSCADDPSFTRRDFVKAGVTVYRDATPCMRAFRAAIDFGEYVKAHKSGATNPERPAGLDRQAAATRLKAAGVKLTEREAKAVLALYGFPTAQERLATGPDEAAAHARLIGGPVALKIDSPDIAHKTDAGALRLNVEGDDAVRGAYKDVMSAARRYAPHAVLNGVLVQAMAPKGVEMMLGIVSDPVFGSVVAVGLGGIYVEVLKDVAYRSAPVTQRQAKQMVGELRSARILEGARGLAPRDSEALIDLIVRLSWFAHDFRNDVAELDLNPVIVLERGAGARVVDALIVRSGRD
ncbi:MAG TPA: acetate--CoA ligase family protein [Burkholderiales bacterium]|nr:acetate--CoA ligase family protein [Burkholderiales bacterium]